MAGIGGPGDSARTVTLQMPYQSGHRANSLFAADELARTVYRAQPKADIAADLDFDVRHAEAGTFDEKTKRLELEAEYPLAGDVWHQRTVIEQTSPDVMTAVSYLRFGSVPEWKGVEITYKRRR